MAAARPGLRFGHGLLVVRDLPPAVEFAEADRCAHPEVVAGAVGLGARQAVQGGLLPGSGGGGGADNGGGAVGVGRAPLIAGAGIIRGCGRVRREDRDWWPSQSIANRSRSSLRKVVSDRERAQHLAAISTSRHIRSTSFISSTDRHAAVARRGSPTTTARHCARDTATLRRRGSNRNWRPRADCCASLAHIEISTTGASCPWKRSTLPTRAPAGSRASSLRIWRL